MLSGYPLLLCNTAVQYLGIEMSILVRTYTLFLFAAYSSLSMMPANVRVDDPNVDDIIVHAVGEPSDRWFKSDGSSPMVQVIRALRQLRDVHRQLL